MSRRPINKKAPKLSIVILDRFLVSQRVHREETKASCLNLHLNSVVRRVPAISRGSSEE